MRSGKAPGLSEISVDDMKEWRNVAHKENPAEEDIALWEKTIELMQRCFAGDLHMSFLNRITCIIPKDDFGGKRGIGLIEFGHKLNSEIINLRMMNSISFCKEIHDFRHRRGTFA